MSQIIPILTGGKLSRTNPETRAGYTRKAHLAILIELGVKDTPRAPLVTISGLDGKTAFFDRVIKRYRKLIKSDEKAKNNISNNRSTVSNNLNDLIISGYVKRSIADKTYQITPTGIGYYAMLKAWNDGKVYKTNKKK